MGVSQCLYNVSSKKFQKKTHKTFTLTQYYKTTQILALAYIISCIYCNSLPTAPHCSNAHIPLVLQTHQAPSHVRISPSCCFSQKYSLPLLCFYLGFIQLWSLPRLGQVPIKFRLLCYSTNHN